MMNKEVESRKYAWSNVGKSRIIYIAWLNSTHGKKSENYAVILAIASVPNSGQNLTCE